MRSIRAAALTTLLLLAGALVGACGSGVTEVADDPATVPAPAPTVTEPTRPETTTTTAEATTTTTEAPTPTTLDLAATEPTAPGDLGEDDELDALAEECFDGDVAACDQLFFESPAGSDYEAYGDSCGGRNEPAGLCVNIYGDG